MADKKTGGGAVLVGRCGPKVDWRDATRWDRPIAKDRRTRVPEPPLDLLEFCRCGCGEKLDGFQLMSGFRTGHAGRMTAAQILAGKGRGRLVF